MKALYKRWLKMIRLKLLGYLLFFIDDVGKRQEAYRAMNRQKEKPVSLAGHHRRLAGYNEIQRQVNQL